MIEVSNLHFSYDLEGRKVQVLNGLDFTVSAGEFVAIQGPSGSGKSTLFYILGFLLKPTSGKLVFDGININNLSDDQLTVIRNEKIGFIFQQFHLLSKTSTIENILLPKYYPSELKAVTPADRQRAGALAEDLGLKNHLAHFPNQLSGGQQQRVAIARALMNDVELIMADEPTGNLDSTSASHIMDVLKELNKKGKTIVLITHDSEVAKKCSRILYMRDGKLVGSEENRESEVNEEAKVSKHPEKVLRVGNYSKIPSKYTLSLYRKIASSVFPLVRENLIRNKARSILTMLGVVIGIASVLAMMTLGQFTKKKILETYEEMGVNKLIIRGYPNWNLKATDIISTRFMAFDWAKDFVPLKRLVPEIHLMSPVLFSWGNTVTAGGRSMNDKVNSLGVDREYVTITNRKIKLGRNFSMFHIANRSPVCLIGHDIAVRIFNRIDPIGQILSVASGENSSFPCKIIGVMGPVTSNVDWSPPNRNVLLPYTYLKTVAGNWWQTQIHEATLQVSPGQDVEKAGKKIKAYFEQKYGKSGEFGVDSDSTMIAQMKRFLNLFTVLLTAIASISLLVGGIGINNMMLVSVSERIKEFGLRKALGATHRSIRIQILMESLCICLMAGVIGVALGFMAYEGLIYGATKFVPSLKFEWIFEPAAAISSFFAIITVGIASGFIPAVRAERLQVIEALRTE